MTITSEGLDTANIGWKKRMSLETQHKFKLVVPAPTQARVGRLRLHARLDPLPSRGDA